MNYEDLLTVKQVESSNDGAKVDNTSSDRWSTEVDELFDTKYHSWLGEKLVGGSWQINKYLNRLMNEKCASYLIGQVSSRFNKNVNFSVLDDNEIIWMVGDMLEDINDVLIDNYEIFDIKSDYMSSIINEVKSLTYSLLKIPYHGGMRIHIGDKNKTIINKQEMASNQDY